MHCNEAIQSETVLRVIVYPVRIGPPQPNDLAYSAISANPVTIRIDNFAFQSNASERTADNKYDGNGFRISVYNRRMPVSVNVQIVHPRNLAAVRREVAPG